MRFLRLITFVGIMLAIGCFLDASSPQASAVTCDHVCNTHRTTIRCGYIGGGYPYVGWNWYVPQCAFDTNVGDSGIINYTYTINIYDPNHPKKIIGTKTGTYYLDNRTHFDTATELPGTCTSVSSQGQQTQYLSAADQDCPCPCTGWAIAPDGTEHGPCTRVEGIYPGTPVTGNWLVSGLNACQ